MFIVVLVTSSMILLYTVGMMLFGRWRNWIREDPSVHPYKWLRPDLVPPAPFLQCKLHLTPGGSGVLADPAEIDEEIPKGLASLILSLWVKGYLP